MDELYKTLEASALRGAFQSIGCVVRAEFRKALLPA